MKALFLGEDIASVKILSYLDSEFIPVVPFVFFWKSWALTADEMIIPITMAITSTTTCLRRADIRALAIPRNGISFMYIVRES